MRIRNRPDMYAGLMFVVIGLAGVYLSQEYQIGTANEMGPGYFPLLLASTLVLLGACIALRAMSPLAKSQAVARFVWQPLVFILGAVLLFAAALPWLGFAVALFLLIIVSSFAGHDWRIREMLLSYLVLLAVSYFVFIKGLAVPFPAWPVFFTN